MSQNAGEIIFGPLWGGSQCKDQHPLFSSDNRFVVGYQDNDEPSSRVFMSLTSEGNRSFYRARGVIHTNGSVAAIVEDRPSTAENALSWATAVAVAGLTKLRMAEPVSEPAKLQRPILKRTTPNKATIGYTVMNESDTIRAGVFFNYDILTADTAFPHAVTLINAGLMAVHKRNPADRISPDQLLVRTSRGLITSPNEIQRREIAIATAHNLFALVQ